MNGTEAKIPGCIRINGRLKIRDLPSEEGKKIIPGTVNEENSTTGYVASFQLIFITSTDNSRVTTVPEIMKILLHMGLHIADKTIGLTTMDKRTGLEQVVLQVQSRNV